MIFHLERLILLDKSQSLSFLDLKISFMSHHQRVIYGFSSFFIRDLLIFRIGDGVEKNGSGLMMISELLLLIFIHSAQGNGNFIFYGCHITISNIFPKFHIKAKKKTFYSILPIVKSLTIKNGRFCTIVIAFVI